ncbi:hypothetical protein FGG08_003282 [Glutinoglossum americanum]|uniref:UDP-N-acetylglucosamine transferase subunit ALG13 n=1 Tax=Glutinoglossum americanum TaxID=1670608 RepID=A0A9P8I4Q5_9PEZI|nr:hypothetical protein FGG08_003282 [Glutinoglossum americanum]
MIPPQTPRPRKLCFVTIGATASFNSLISTALDRPFLKALREAGYTDLRLQFGREGRAIFDDFIINNEDGSEERYGLNITGFEYNRKGLGQEMRGATAYKGGVEGVVVSHAGSGSILDALRLNIPIIVVPNPSLLDNHQVELAEELASQDYVVHGKIDDLPAAIADSEKLREKHKAWPPVNSGEDPSGRGLAGVMEYEMGFVD